MYGKKGFTLVELIVVMAVVSIMTVMTASFTMLVSAWSHWGTNRYQLINSERQAEQYMRKFISSYDNSRYYFEVNSNGTVLTAVSVADHNERHTIQYVDSGELEFETTSGEGYCPLDHIYQVLFSVRTNERNQQLIGMRLYYELPDNGVGLRDGQGLYSILVCTRATGVHA